jgi:hypothetical protein
MNKRMESAAQGLAATMLALMMGCAAGQHGPVKTTTSETGTAVAPPVKEAKERDNALVRFIHAIPGQRAVDAWVDDSKPFTKIEYKLVTAYQEVPGERHTLRVRPTGEDAAQPLLESRESFADGKHYTIIALPGSFQTSPALRVIDDHLTAPSSGKAKVRVIHASPDAGEVEIFAQGKNEALFDDVRPNSESGYREVDPMAGAIEVRPRGQRNAVLTMPGLKLEANKIYTIILTGWAKTEPRLEAVLVEDQIG